MNQAQKEPSIRLMLTKDQEDSLKKYFYEIATETLQEAKRDLAIDRDLLNKKQIAEWLDTSVETINDYMKRGLPHSILGERTYYFSKAEVRKWILQYNKK